jgi:hypothetical protein
MLCAAMENAHDKPMQRLSTRQRVVQVVGLLIGIGLMVWALRMAVSGDNRQALENLRSASPVLVAWLFALSVLSIVLDAAVFWCALAPRRHLPKGEVLATNAIAVFLSILPFKLGMIVRSAIHVRRHGVAIKELVSWFIAFGGVTMAAIVACAGGALLSPRVQAQPTLGVIVACAGGLLVCVWLAIVGVGQLATRSNAKWLRVMTLGTADLIAHPGFVGAGLLLRAIDVATFAARFAIAGMIVGVGMSASQSAQLGSVYLVLQAGAPAGALGFAEAGTAGAGALIGIDAKQVALLALIVTAARMLVAGAMAAGAWVWLRPDKLLRQQPAKSRD